MGSMATRDQQDIHVRERCLRCNCPETDRRVEEAPPNAGSQGDHRPLCNLALDPVARRWTLSMDQRGFVPIGKRTSDKRVRVRQKGFSRCAASFLYVAGCLAVPARPAYRPCRTGDTGGGRERPPCLDCLDRQCGVGSCAWSMPPCAGSRSRLASILAGRPASQRGSQRWPKLSIQ